MNERGWYKIHRCLFEHPIWLTSSPEHKVILVTLMGMANHDDNEWIWNGEQFTVKRGQMITSLDSIKKLCGKGVSTQHVRGALNRFEKKFHFLTNISTKTGRLITIENYDKWQGDDDVTNKVTNKELTKRSQRANKELTPNKNNKNNKNDKEERGQAPVSLSVVRDYVREKNLNVDPDVFYAYYEENGWKKKNGQPVRDWKKTLATWAAREQKKIQQEQEPASYKPFKVEKVAEPVSMPDSIRKKWSKT